MVIVGRLVICSRPRYTSDDLFNLRVFVGKGEADDLFENVLFGAPDTTRTARLDLPCCECLHEV